MKKHGFTLAEVLIVLVILGVISALTVPNLMGNADEKSRVTAFKKGVAELNNALQLASAENGASPNGQTVETLINDVFVPVLKITRKGTNGFQTADGITYLFEAVQTPSSCPGIPSDTANQGFDSACFRVYIDTNGVAKGPNQPTVKAVKGHLKDRYLVMMYDNGVITGTSVSGDVFADTVDKESASYTSRKAATSNYRDVESYSASMSGDNYSSAIGF